MMKVIKIDDAAQITCFNIIVFASAESLEKDAAAFRYNS